MLHHRFKKVVVGELERLDFLRSVEKGTFRGFFSSIWERMRCFVRIHKGPLLMDDDGFYRQCTRCSHREDVVFWRKSERE